ncbi:MAG: response regulator [Chloroflexi bacterium]|nr:response regulator [Chloroflexota bacterium]
MQTILVADDKANVRNLVREYLEAEGFHVVIAANGREALYAARHEKPDLILLDIMMPEMSGYDFIKAYRKEREMPIVLLTAKLDETDKVLGLELGADNYVTKPFGMVETNPVWGWPSQNPLSNCTAAVSMLQASLERAAA